jgi:hypothetical protein
LNGNNANLIGSIVFNHLNGIQTAWAFRHRSPAYHTHHPPTTNHQPPTFNQLVTKKTSNALNDIGG